MTDMGAGEADGTGQISRRVGKSQSFLTVINAMIFTHTRMLAGGVRAGRHRAAGQAAGAPQGDRCADHGESSGHPIGAPCSAVASDRRRR
jgi:hypothetical protein